MATAAERRRASPWGELEVTLLLQVLIRRDYWLRNRHAHPMEHKRAVLSKQFRVLAPQVRRMLRSRCGVERSLAQIRRKIADVKYKTPERIDNIRRQIRNERAAARRRPPPSPREASPPSVSSSGEPQQAAQEPSPPAAGGAPSDSNGCADLDQRPPPSTLKTPSPASSAAIDMQQGPPSPEPCTQEANLGGNSPAISPDHQEPPSRSMKDTINRMIQHQDILEREVRIHGELLHQLKTQFAK